VQESFAHWMSCRLPVAARSAKRITLVAVTMLSTATRIEPGVFGIFDPVLPLLEGISERLTPEQLDAVVAHEMCHVRWRDDLISALHMAVEALFRINPVVWGVGPRLSTNGSALATRRS
jgi:bla regulator protein blaR1